MDTHKLILETKNPAAETRPSISYAIEAQTNTAKLLAELRKKILSHGDFMFGWGEAPGPQNTDEPFKAYGLLPKLRDSSELLEDEAKALAEAIDTFLGPAL